MTAQERVNDIRDKSVPILKKCGVVRSSLFGSAARGELTENSDIDFLVEFEDGRSLFDLVQCKQELEEVLGRDVDLVSSKALKPRLRSYVEQGKIDIL